METQHLWEVDHDYYGAEGNYQEVYESWQSFVADGCPTYDMDLNLVYRFDWLEADEDNERDTDELHIFWIQQRKSALVSVVVRVNKSDEDAVIVYLQSRLEHMRRLWLPLIANYSEVQVS